MQDMPMHQESSKPSMDMIKEALMKVIADMTAMESDRMLPDEHPMKSKSVEQLPAASPDEDMAGTSTEDPAESDGSGLDALMGEADKADADGGMPEDRGNDLPPEIMEVVNRKKAEMGK